MKGQKTGGREVGTPNKKSKLIEDLLAEKYPDYHPVLALAEIANDKKRDINIRFHCHKEIAKYICPQLRSIEQKNVPDDTTIRIIRTIVGNQPNEKPNDYDPNDISLKFDKPNQNLDDSKPVKTYLNIQPKMV